MLNKNKYRAVPIRLIDVDRIEKIFPVEDGVKRWAAIKNIIDFWEENHVERIQSKQLQEEEEKK